jgi:hypothetical protein
MKVMAPVQERAELRKTVSIFPERAPFRLSKNQVEGRSGE